MILDCRVTRSIVQILEDVLLNTLHYVFFGVLLFFLVLGWWASHLTSVVILLSVKLVNLQTKKELKIKRHYIFVLEVLSLQFPTISTHEISQYS